MTDRATEKRKRRSKEKEGRAERKSEAEREDKAAPTGETREQAGFVDLTALPVWQLLQIFLGVLDQVAWQRMGLVVNPQTQKVEKDMEQARAAIDCYEAVLKVLDGHIDPNVKRRLDVRLTDLKLNYASHL